MTYLYEITRSIKFDYLRANRKNTAPNSQN